jgi:glycosyltransferase involved in cell wall biosynthesis
MNVLAITAIRPGIGFANGFSARYAHLIHALSLEYQLRVAILDRKTLVPLPERASLPEGCDVWDARTESRAHDVSLPLARLRQAASLPSWASPVPGFDRAVGQQSFALAIGLHYRSADVLLSLPETIAKVAVLEEYDPSLNGRSLWCDVRQRIDVRREERLFRRIGENVDLIVAISDEEAIRWRARCPGAVVAVVPHTVDCINFSPRDSPREVDVGFFGMLTRGRDLGALDAARALRADSRTVSRRIAFIGAEPSSEIQAWAAAGALVTGRVRDMREWYARTGVVVAADPAGPGTKTTVLEAWAMAKPVVATVGALRGLPARDGENVLVVPSAAHVAGAVANLLEDDALASRIGRAGRATALRERDVGGMRNEFLRLCNALLAPLGNHPF